MSAGACRGQERTFWIPWSLSYRGLGHMWVPGTLKSGPVEQEVLITTEPSLRSIVRFLLTVIECFRRFRVRLLVCLNCTLFKPNLALLSSQPSSPTPGKHFLHSGRLSNSHIWERTHSTYLSASVYFDLRNVLRICSFFTPKSWILFFFITEYYCTLTIYHIFVCLFLSMNGFLGRICFLGILDAARINMAEELSLSGMLMRQYHSYTCLYGRLSLISSIIFFKMNFFSK